MRSNPRRPRRLAPLTATSRADGLTTYGHSSGTVIPRRQVVRGGLASLAAVFAGRTLAGCDRDEVEGEVSDVRLHAEAPVVPFAPRALPSPPALRSLVDAIEPLGPPDANGVRLPPGFTCRVVARSGERVAPSSHVWHASPDGGSVFPHEDGGWIYVSNSEVPRTGGVGALRFAPDGTLVDAFPILQGTNVNCAGGKTPWGAWLSCEEAPRGRVFECDPWGEREAVVRPSLGVFRHEAAAVDPVNAHVYLTEDEPDGRFYRFVPAQRTPEGHPDLARGRLEVASVARGGAVRWLEVPDPRFRRGVPTRAQVAESTVFRGGEGIWYHDGVVYFATKGDDRVWAYDVADAKLSILYDRADHSGDPIRGVDNLTVTCCGDVLVAEDGGYMRLVAILPDGRFVPLVQVLGQARSEITGPAFDPSGTRLYFSSQRGVARDGLTYEVTGPFHAPA
ncbi:MAG: DUF839 domain-containing protein [Sandaracinus sp.]|nr:DUF839 domain-containing protein [Sandaracinus sp.]MCB9622472.1 DUF839 domain-containing protein [Sandaracinus sp.]